MPPIFTQLLSTPEMSLMFQLNVIDDPAATTLVFEIAGPFASRVH